MCEADVGGVAEIVVGAGNLRPRGGGYLAVRHPPDARTECTQSEFRLAAMLHKAKIRSVMKSRIIDRTLTALYVAMILYLCCTAIWPRVLTAAPKPLAWFGQPGSVWTIAVVLVIPLLFVLHWRFNRNAPIKIPLLLLTTMATSALLLGMSSYWRCHGSLSPFFTPLVCRSRSPL